MTQSADEKILLGRVSGLFGVRGWLRLFSYSRPPAQILDYNPIWLKSANGEWKTLEIEDKQAHADGRLVVKFVGIDDREVARLLMGQDIGVDKHQLQRSDEDFYWIDLMGCQVVKLDGEVIGTVVDMMETGANDVMRVKTPNGETELVPFVMERVIQSVQLAEKRIIVDWESGYF